MESVRGMRLCAAVVSLLVVGGLSVAEAQTQTGFLKRTYRDEAGEHKYQVFIPAGYRPERKWPVILYLHSAGSRGTDGELPTREGPGPYIRANARSFPFITVFPQVEDVAGRRLTGWLADTEHAARALGILAEVEREFSVDRDRAILTGWSMGGYGTWSLAAADPSRWSAIVPVAGGGEAEWAERLKDLPIWAFHGGRDGAIRPDASRKMIEAVRAAGGRPHYTELPGVEHEAWPHVYGMPALYEWILDPSRTPQVPALPSRPDARIPAPIVQEPFVPALEVPRAIYVRLGNEMLESLSHAVPGMVPRNLLVGRIPDIQDVTQSSGRSVRVRFSNITYSGELHRAHLQAIGPERLNVQLAVRNVVLTIGSTFVSGPGNRSAVAGQIQIVVAHRYPIWLNFNVRPYVDAGRVRLLPLESYFQIPPDNWYVTNPAGVSARGLFMRSDRVARSLVQGLYGSKARLESQVTSIVPSLVRQMEQTLELLDVGRLVTGFWPLPVYEPRLRVWPQEVVTDAEGISLAMGVTAAAVDPQAPRKPVQVVPPVGIAAAQVPRSTSLQVGLAGGLLEPLTRMLIEAGVARIDLPDIPIDEFAALADRRVIEEIIPDLKRYDENARIRSELVLAEPLTVADASQGQFRFVLPRILVVVSLKTDSRQKAWQPYAEFELQLAQAAAPRVLAEGHSGRAIRLDWTGDADLRGNGRFAPGYEPEDPTIRTDQFLEQFARAWKAWTESSPVAERTVPDLEVGTSRLRLSDVGWTAPTLHADFRTPATRLTNRSEVPVTYETRSIYSGVWGGPYTLAPGESHPYNLAYPLTYRRSTPLGWEIYTLPVGSSSVFRVPKSGGPPRLYQSAG